MPDGESTNSVSNIDRGLGTTYGITSAAIKAIISPTSLGMATVEDAAGDVTTYTLDVRGRASEVDQPSDPTNNQSSAVTQTWRRNGHGDPYLYTDPDGHSTVSFYNDSSDGQPIEVDAPDGGASHYEAIRFIMKRQWPKILGVMRRSFLSTLTETYKR